MYCTYWLYHHSLGGKELWEVIHIKITEVKVCLGKDKVMEVTGWYYFPSDASAPRLQQQALHNCTLLSPPTAPPLYPPPPRHWSGAPLGSGTPPPPFTGTGPWFHQLNHVLDKRLNMTKKIPEMKSKLRGCFLTLSLIVCKTRRYSDYWLKLKLIRNLLPEFQKSRLKQNPKQKLKENVRICSRKIQVWINCWPFSSNYEL